MNVNLKVQTIPVAANGSVRIAQAGTFLSLISSAGSFQFSIDGGSFQDGLTVLSMDFYRDVQAANSLLKIASTPGTSTPAFKEIIFKDTSGSANSIQFVIANDPVNYYAPPSIVFIKDAATYTKPTNGTLAAGAMQTFAGLDGAKVRKQIVITNEDAALVLYVTDNTGATRGAVIYPQRPWTIALSGSITIKNPNGAGVNFSVLETFYS